MTEHAPEHDPLAAAEDLTAALEGTHDDLTALRRELETARKASEARDAQLAKAARRSRHIITGLVISFSLDLLITAGFAYNTIRVNDTQNASHANQIAACRQANVNRAEDVAIWHTFFMVAAPPATRTAKTTKLIGAIDAKVRIKDKPRNCVALYRLSPRGGNGTR